ncbi:CLUMA_CG008423, isoform A [Clunio marinus]|uniref:Gamma-tubulin complex component n=1 Tax=Clunio marinus TaxID=568069 RepID=A0A1J1I5S3_9DIPT|nr:CLUMA_CG008423, isoform A [Clunio marinus]
MIHDIILSLLSDKESKVIKDLMTLEISSNFIHPAEMKTLKDISKISNFYREIKKFISQYSTCANENSRITLEIEANPLPPGFYLQAFANGLEDAMEFYNDTVMDLEKKFLRKPTLSLMFIFHELEKFRPLFEFAIRFINGLKSQRLFGCQILQYLQDHAMHGDSSIMKFVQIIQKSVYMVFIQQLCQWVMYGKFVDIYGEFFICHIEENHDKHPTLNTQYSATTFHSSEPSINLDLWHYEINYEMLPIYFPKSWAEKVLFIGQTVLMFNSDARETEKNMPAESSEFIDAPEKHTVWGDREQILFGKFHILQDIDKLTVLTFEKIVDEIKLCVTEHLSDITVIEADLVKQLKLIKDFYLLGRGELFYEFIKALKPLKSKNLGDDNARAINQAFQLAATSVNIIDETELFYFEVIKNNDKSKDENGQSIILEATNFFDSVFLRYKIKWPLHLLFSPKVLEHYNELFRFLIRIKKTQHDLHLVWCHHREEKIERSSELLQFRNKLMFIVDNLQYYLQADVLESQFSIMMDKLRETKDFEQIQRAHSCFQANILGHCFLLESAQPMTRSVIGNMSTSTTNPVFDILDKILCLTDEFTAFTYIVSNPMCEIDRQTFYIFEDTFSEQVSSLLKLLSSLQTSAQPLAQLLLRLDFNYWFSTEIESKNNVQKY